MALPNEHFSERQLRERQYYNTYRRQHRVQEVTFDYVFSPVARPWNSYWCTYNEVFSRFRDPSQRLLDFGCGAGVASVRYARCGYTTYGFDISEANIDNCRMLAEKYDVADRTHFASHIAEILPYENHFFDIVVGIDILHHIDIPKAMPEIRRVLKPGGVAIFRECIEVRAWDTLRNWRIVTHFYPKEESFEDHITADERKVNQDDLDIITRSFPIFRARRFGVFSRLHRLVNDPKQRVLGNLQKFDYRLMKVIPATARLGGELLITLENR